VVMGTGAAGDAEGSAAGHGFVEMPREARAYAAGLYAALRRADEMGAGRIVVEWPVAGAEGDGAVWEAIGDRLGRASAERDRDARERR